MNPTFSHSIEVGMYHWLQLVVALGNIGIGRIKPKLPAGPVFDADSLYGILAIITALHLFKAWLSTAANTGCFCKAGLRVQALGSRHINAIALMITCKEPQIFCKDGTEHVFGKLFTVRPTFLSPKSLQPISHFSFPVHRNSCPAGKSLPLVPVV